MGISVHSFLTYYQYEFNVNLSEKQEDSLTEILHDLPETFDEMKAYILATIKYDTGDSFLPQREWDRGKGHAYGEVDPDTKVSYYGRGYIPLTWKNNYLAIGLKLGIDLVNKPDLALEPKNAMNILWVGIIDGYFGKPITNYIKDCDKYNYVLARRSVTNTNNSRAVAEYAHKFLKILRAC